MCVCVCVCVCVRVRASDPNDHGQGRGAVVEHVGGPVRSQRYSVGGGGMAGGRPDRMINSDGARRGRRGEGHGGGAPGLQAK